MSQHSDEELLSALRRDSLRDQHKLSAEQRASLFTELENRKKSPSAWIWKLVTFCALAASCWIVFAPQFSTDSDMDPSSLQVAEVKVTGQSPEPMLTPSLYSVWKNDDPIDQSIQNIQQRIQIHQRPAFLSERTISSRESEIRRRIQRLRNDLS